MHYSANHVGNMALVLSQNGLRSNLISKSFLGGGGGMPPDPPYFCMIIDAYIHINIRHPCKPISENPAYGPEQCLENTLNTFCLSNRYVKPFFQECTNMITHFQKSLHQ